MNVRAARLHVLFDLAGSVLAVAAGLAIALGGWSRIDSLLSLVIVTLAATSGVRILREAGAVLMDRVPPGIDLDLLARDLRGVPGVLAVHDMHCWTIATGFIAFAAHLEIPPAEDPHPVIAEAAALLRTRYGIDHVTLQPEVAAIHHTLTLSE